MFSARVWTSLWIVLVVSLHHPEGLFAFFLMPLARSPCGEQLSTDAWRRRRAGRPTAELRPRPQPASA
jgi:hypothetical protein